MVSQDQNAIRAREALTDPPATDKKAAPAHPAKNLEMRNVVILLAKAPIKFQMMKKKKEPRYCIRFLDQSPSVAVRKNLTDDGRATVEF